MKNKPTTRAATPEERGVVQFGATSIEYTVTRSRRRKKTIQIRLDGEAGVRIAAPVRTSPEHIRQVVLKRGTWIVQRAAQVALHSRPKEFVGGESLPYLGREAPLLIDHGNVRRPSITFDRWTFRILVPVALEGEPRRAAIRSTLVAWYRSRAAEVLGQQVDRWAQVVGLNPARVLIRDQRRRWGSCAPDGVLRFNWRIILAPPDLLDYLVVHELLHLRIRNHSPAFWSELARYIPDYKLRRSLLRKMEPSLTI